MTTLESSLSSNLPLVQLPLASSSCTPRVRALRLLQSFGRSSEEPLQVTHVCCLDQRLFARPVDCCVMQLLIACIFCSLNLSKTPEAKASCHLMRVIYQYSVHLPPPRSLRNRNQVPNFLRTRHPFPCPNPSNFFSSCFWIGSRKCQIMRSHFDRCLVCVSDTLRKHCQRSEYMRRRAVNLHKDLQILRGTSFRVPSRLETGVTPHPDHDTFLRSNICLFSVPYRQLSDTN